MWGRGPFARISRWSAAPLPQGGGPKRNPILEIPFYLCIYPLTPYIFFLNFSDVSRIFSFLLLYYLCILGLDVMIRLPLVLV